MPIAVHTPSEEMYLIYCDDRKGLLTWNHDDKRYIMAFTTSDKAERYNHEVMNPLPGEVRILKKIDSTRFARKMVSKQVYWMIIDYPPINDQVEEWNPISSEAGRDYGIVDLKMLVDKVDGNN